MLYILSSSQRSQSQNIMFSFFPNKCYLSDLSRVWASQDALVVKNLPTNAGDIRDIDSIPGSGRSPGGGHGNTLQYFCLENPMARGAWWAIVHGAAKSQTRLKQLSCSSSRRFVIAFLLRSKHLLILWLKSLSAVILEPKKIKSDTVSTVSPFIFHEVVGPEP